MVLVVFVELPLSVEFCRPRDVPFVVVTLLVAFAPGAWLGREDANSCGEGEAREEEDVVPAKLAVIVCVTDTETLLVLETLAE